MNFEIESERVSDGVYVVSLGGEIDLYTAPEFKQQLIEAVQAGARLIVVDLTATTFIDSTTLGILVGAVKRLRESGGELSLVCRDHNIAKIFEITGLDRVFPIHPSREEALALAVPGEAPSS
jgi:anti-sigma B factor antagonist